MSAIVTESSEPEEDISDLSIRVQIFTCFWMSGMFGNLDTGVIPTTLHLIMKDLDITQGQCAFLASVSFLATAVGSLFVSPLMRIFKVKHVIVIATMLNASSTLFFLYSSNYWHLMGARIA